MQVQHSRVVDKVDFAKANVNLPKAEGDAGERLNANLCAHAGVQ